MIILAGVASNICFLKCVSPVENFMGIFEKFHPATGEDHDLSHSIDAKTTGLEQMLMDPGLAKRMIEEDPEDVRAALYNFRTSSDPGMGEERYQKLVRLYSDKLDADTKAKFLDLAEGPAEEFKQAA